MKALVVKSMLRKERNKFKHFQELKGTNSRLICGGNQVILGNHRFQGITDSQIFERELMWFWNQWLQRITGSRESLVPHTGEHETTVSSLEFLKVFRFVPLFS